jgi:hypothetical protein
MDEIEVELADNYYFLDGYTYTEVGTVISTAIKELYELTTKYQNVDLEEITKDVLSEMPQPHSRN